MVKMGGLGLAVAFLALARPALADEAAEPAGDDAAVVVGKETGKAVVTVESSGTAVTVAQITDRMAATGYGAGGTVTVVGVAYRDLCVTPCTFEIKPGLHEIGVHGDGVSGATEQFDLQSGPNKLRAAPGSAWLAYGGYVTTVIGGTGLVIGVVFLFVSDDVMDFPALPLTLIGAGTTGLGIGMMVAGSTSLDKVGSAKAPTLTGRLPNSLVLRGTF